MTEGAEDGEGGGSSGSESDPSEDNMDEEEIAKLVPLKPPKKKVPDNKKKPVPDIKVAKKNTEAIALSGKKDPKALVKPP